MNKAFQSKHVLWIKDTLMMVFYSILNTMTSEHLWLVANE